MFGGNHVLRIGLDSERDITRASVAAGLSDKIIAYIFSTGDADISDRSAFQTEAERFKGDPHLKEVLSGAAYNIGYGRYVSAGGGRIVNKYLGYMRYERRAQSRHDIDTLMNMAKELDRRDKKILRPYRTLDSLRLWKSRPENPNELEFYHNIQMFVIEVGLQNIG